MHLVGTGGKLRVLIYVWLIPSQRASFIANGNWITAGIHDIELKLFERLTGQCSRKALYGTFWAFGTADPSLEIAELRYRLINYSTTYHV